MDVVSTCECVRVCMCTNSGIQVAPTQTTRASVSDSGSHHYQPGGLCQGRRTTRDSRAQAGAGGGRRGPGGPSSCLNQRQTSEKWPQFSPPSCTHGDSRSGVCVPRPLSLGCLGTWFASRIRQKHPGAGSDLRPQEALAASVLSWKSSADTERVQASLPEDQTRCPHRGPVRERHGVAEAGRAISLTLR